MLDTLLERPAYWTPTLPDSPILIVAEDDAVRRALNFRFAMAGYATELAENGEHAIDLFRKESQEYVAVLMDRQMSGLDGEETMAVLRCIGCDAAVVYLDEHRDFGELEATVREMTQ